MTGDQRLPTTQGLQRAALDMYQALLVLLDATEDSIGKRYRDRAKRAIAKAEGRLSKSPRYKTIHSTRADK